MDTNINRVYVNPNFKKVPTRAIYDPEPVYSKNNLYVNPNFMRNTNDVQQFNKQNRKIYVNPNFIKSTNVLETNKVNENTSDINYSSRRLENLNSMVNDNLNSILTNIENSKPIPIRTPSKSKYRLIRKNDRVEKEPKCKESSTIKINKYKSIPFHSYKNNLQMVKNNSTKQVICSNNTSTSILNNINTFVKRSSYKLIRHNSQGTMNNSLKLTQKSNSQKCKRNNNLKCHLKLKVSNGVRKKNNIPCRLFTKYGMCIRNLYGTCEYVHDKKHVSLCRKFLKGICHEKQCLLSHELSSKKMPTCYFYLKGRCTKDDCQYLHVKLNDKSKICHDFLKGYCDKGDMCLHRHIRPETDKNNDRKRYSSSNRNIKLNILKSMKTNHLRKQPEGDIKKILKSSHNNEQGTNDVDCRYFKDLQNKEAMCEVLKPTRCKLGTLPSFIHL